MKYRYLTSEQRYIKAYPKCNKSQKIIAQQLGVSESTISRELKRNRLERGDITLKMLKLTIVVRVNYIVILGFLNGN
ncbi:helix-turn-helix domain-containing protein [Capnocytophaga canimorsus]|uniref:helix-turn-helix domain-containing protein n=1 Tax=Capnocytophaga canimorsus TaxID=28188 RepID=UPI000F6FC685|nr:helix-turn-helix domain-containing protein [Capnocytophaga canimorsus]VEJ20251.1 Transposase and inactivated derivatives, IS30 family [Capnocytophaga canimorsus]